MEEPEQATPSLSSSRKGSWARVRALSPSMLDRANSSFESASERQRKNSVINRLSQIVNSKAYRNEDPKATRQEVATLYSAIHELALSNGTVRQNELRFVKLLGEGAFARVELCQLKEATVQRLGDPGNPGALPVSQARALQRNKGRVAVKCMKRFVEQETAKGGIRQVPTPSQWLCGC